MNRYQIYLNPDSVNTLDELTKLTNLSRSKIIRDIIDRMAKVYGKLLEAHSKKLMKNNSLLKMAGFAKGPSRDISTNVNNIYLKD
ncbi:MAG: hypothetical protein A3F31_03065 [Candidatus Levybacteria bacterium RIFCSPHIGHO2_12_FULL_38_12]|nr:MAG: hypothetical protein A3F31_03065 [Candidatus Levybacteria bacterium RIFCSPHIGHO2_12_FULL_38_12]